MAHGSYPSLQSGCWGGNPPFNLQWEIQVQYFDSVVCKYWCLAHHLGTSCFLFLMSNPPEKYSIVCVRMDSEVQETPT